MIKLFNNIDFEKYHTFFLEFIKENNTFSHHLVRPCIATYNDIVSGRLVTYTLEAAVLAFDNSTPLTEILIECAIHGISPDFIEIKVASDDKDKWRSEYRIFQMIDTHKEDIMKYIEGIEAPEYYIAKNKNCKNALKFLIIDRFSQDSSVNFLKGQYDKKAVIAGFKDYDCALSYCKNLNLK